jgi:signal transduction histidine kinase
LSLSKQIVDAHGGRITVDSQLGAGTAVSLWLPA